MKRRTAIILFTLLAISLVACKKPVANVPNAYPPSFFYNGVYYSLADWSAPVSDLPKGSISIGNLEYAEGESDEKLYTKAKSVADKEVWVNSDNSSQAYVKMEYDGRYHLFIPSILKCRLLYHNGDLYIDCLDCDVFSGTEWYDAANEYLGGGSIPAYELMPDDAVLLGTTSFDMNYVYPNTELEISWGEYSGKEVYADPNNSDVLFLLYPGGAAPNANNGVRVEIFLRIDSDDDSMVKDLSNRIP